MSNIIITGCSTGIGLETAKYLKARFITVYPTARHMKDVHMLKELGFENAMQLDVTKPQHIKNVIESLKIYDIDYEIAKSLTDNKISWTLESIEIINGHIILFHDTETAYTTDKNIYEKCLILKGW